MNRTPWLAALALFVASAASHAQAGALTPGIYELFNHPDGAIATPTEPYGIRLDAGTPPVGDGPTFDVEGAGPVLLTWPLFSTTATITGSTINNETGEIWDVDYTLTGVTAVSDGFIATGGTGTLTYADVGPAPTPSAYTLTGALDGDGEAFEFRMDGYRLDNDSTSIVGRGWLEGSGNFNDWLVIAVQNEEFMIPEPTSAALLSIGALAALRRRK
ncbi:MAG: PEP-CTERM sorting domain-containing protein [Planctomycetota bacterium]